ncbi:NAD(P)-dependent oxidoreductase [Nocardia sp. CY41]|uniref:NAD(P)-dependent oxidoreductase n=1 Tax=Nocardia sp. CY41 TaxID=2608686 RepID=UPI0019163D9F|nr:NAD(P)-dependent oxidoreductase [Nocardia sp. CY41]
MSRLRVAVAGAAGYVGSALVGALERSGRAEVVPVVRADYEGHRTAGRYDVLINAACPSKRFWAEQHPGEDRRETVDKTRLLREQWRWDRFVQISSISARTQLDTVYGRHRAEAEQLCSGTDTLVVRLGPMYGGDYRKGVLADMAADRPVFASGRSRQSFAPVDWCAEWITGHLDNTGLREVGARTTVTLTEVRDAVGSHSHFAKDYVDDQFPVTATGSDWPEAAAVIDWLAGRRVSDAQAR